MALLRSLAAFLCVMPASLVFVAQAVLAARGDLSNVKRDGVRGTWAAPSHEVRPGPLPRYPPK
uniref:Uncharacterized protein n=1 Tax=Triticum aestivum TaxID=4565 RepID=A0A080YU45_WHEAT|nr:unnamed protein product [Triticum aestivum]CDM86899.1 unnamed protein product [Triticum aestivum]